MQLTWQKIQLRNKISLIKQLQNNNVNSSPFIMAALAMHFQGYAIYGILIGLIIWQIYADT